MIKGVMIVESKLKPGDVAPVKGTANRFLVIQVMKITCEVCTQTSYKGRLLRPEQMYGLEGKSTKYLLAQANRMIISGVALGEKIKEGGEKV